MSEPQKYTLKESNVRKFYGNIIQSGAFTAQDLGGTEDDFVNQIGGDPDKLVKVRNNMLGTGVVTEADLGGNESLFMQSFLKKKRRFTCFFERFVYYSGKIIRG